MLHQQRVLTNNKKIGQLQQAYSFDDQVQNLNKKIEIDKFQTSNYQLNKKDILNNLHKKDKKLFKTFKSKSCALILIILFIIVISIFIILRQDKSKDQQINPLITNSQQKIVQDANDQKIVKYKVVQDINNKNIVNQEIKIDEQQFKIQYVETQFQGKQTQQSLQIQAMKAMQSQYSTSASLHNLQMYYQRKVILEQIKNLQEMIPDQPNTGYVARDMYYFSVSTKQMILNSNLEQIYQNGQTVFMISKKQHLRAILKTLLVHNINFYSQIDIKLSPFDRGLQQKKKAIELIIQDQKVYFEALYKVSQFEKKQQTRFCLVIPSYNNGASKLYLRNLDSILMQDYDNFHIVYIDDASRDKTGLLVKQYIKQKGISSDKIKIIINQRNHKALYNIYHGIINSCADTDVVGLIDGDDSLLGTNVLTLYNAIYIRNKALVVYSNFLKILTNNKTSFGFGTEVTRQFFYAGELRKSRTLVASHFLTFSTKLFKLIKVQDLRDQQSNKFYQYAYDRAIITPLIQMAFPRVIYVPQIVYEYRNDTGINDGNGQWQRVSKIIQQKPAYSQYIQNV